MKKLLLIPTAAFPYLCALLAYGLVSGPFSQDPVIEVLEVACVASFGLGFMCNIIFAIISRSHEPKSLLKTALILKIIHIPTYILIFVLGLIMGLMFFMTFPFIIFLVIIDYITLFLSGMVSVFSIVKNAKNNIALSVVAVILQFVFCADIISLIVIICTAKGEEKSSVV